MLNERKLTENELEQRQIVLKGLLKNKHALVSKYGKDAEKVMYGIATKKAKKRVEDMNKEKIKELIHQALQKEQGPATNVEPYHDQTSTIDTGFSGRADYGEEDKALGREDELEMKGFEENTLKEFGGGYVELMDIDDKLEDIHYEWEKWREGPMTEPGDIDPAKKDVIQYVVNYLKRSLK